MDNMKLLPCPFCGTGAYTRVKVKRGMAQDFITASVQCEKCDAAKSENVQSGCSIEDMLKLFGQVATNWNERHSFTPLPYIPRRESIGNGEVIWKCPNCHLGVTLDEDELPNYCLNCGVKFAVGLMEEETHA